MPQREEKNYETLIRNEDGSVAYIFIFSIKLEVIIYFMMTKLSIYNIS
jgi:hypothetical protein